jgi:hypothetical protein
MTTPKPPVDPFACVKCQRTVPPMDGVVRCDGCGASFLLRRGASLEQTLVPKPEPKELKLRGAGTLTHTMGALRAEGIFYGALDPIIGHVMMETGGVPWALVSTIAAWREISIPQVLAFVFVVLPFAVLPGVALLLAMNAIAAVIGLVFLSLGALHGYNTFILRALRLRVVSGTGRVLDMTFPAKGRARRRFFEALQVRSGLTPMEVP